MYAITEGSGATARMRRLTGAFAGRLCDKYNNLIRAGSIIFTATGVKFRVVTLKRLPILYPIADLSSGPLGSISSLSVIPNIQFR